MFSYIIIYLVLMIEDTSRRLGMQQAAKFLYASLRGLSYRFVISRENARIPKIVSLQAYQLQRRLCDYNVNFVTNGI